MEIGKEVRDLSQVSTLSTQQENLYLNAPTFFVCPKSVKIIII